eukprot:gene21695-28718_t
MDHEGGARPGRTRTLAVLGGPQTTSNSCHLDAENCLPVISTPSKLTTLGAVKGRQLVDFSALSACCFELKTQWNPSKVEQVVMSDKTTLSIRLRTLAETGWLHLSWHPYAARVCMGAPPSRGSAAEAFTLGEQVQSNLNGLVLIGAKMPEPWERVIQLQFGERPGESPSHFIYCEVMARYSNMILTNGEDEIIACAVQSKGSPMDPPWCPLPQVFGIPPTAYSSFETWRDATIKAAQLAAAETLEASAKKQKKKLAGSAGSPAPNGSGAEHQAAPITDAGGAEQPPGPISAGLVRAFHGVSPFLSEELCFRAGVPPETTADSLSEPMWGALYEQWEGWLESIDKDTFSPCSDAATGRFSVLGSFDSKFSSAFDMLDSYYGNMQATEVHSQLYARLSTAVSQALKKLRGKAKAFEQQLAAAETADAFQKQADLITSYLYKGTSPPTPLLKKGTPPPATRPPPATTPTQPNTPTALQGPSLQWRKTAHIKASDTEAVLEDWDTGEPVTIKLDPRTDAPLEDYAEDADLKALQGVQDDLVQQSYMKPPPEAALAVKWGAKGQKDELVQQSYMKPPPEAALAVKGAAKGRKAEKKKNKKQTALGGSGQTGFRVFTSPSDFQVLIGRNNIQNDELSNRIANDDDIWMHVRGMPGSHAIIRVPAGRKVTDDDLQFTADLTAYFSKPAASQRQCPCPADNFDPKHTPTNIPPGDYLKTENQCLDINAPGELSKQAAA